MSAFFTEFTTRLSAGLLALITLISSWFMPYESPVEAPDMSESVKPTVETVTMIENGESDYVIVIGKDCDATEKSAAEELQKYLNEMSGVKLPIVTDDTAETDYEIIVGKTNREGEDYTVDRETLGKEGVYLKAAGNKLVIAGGELRGTIYAVYEFLELYLDCRWFTRDITVIPERDVVGFPKDLDYTHVPVFEYRKTDWLSPKTGEIYSVANKLNSSMAIDDKFGGYFGFTGGFCHTFTADFVNAAKYFESNPELFALRDGTRVNTQLCLTNPETLEIVIDEVQALLDKDPDATLISLTQADNLEYCMCENCTALDEAHGGQQGTNLTFVNAVADHFKDKYPDLKFDTFAYRYTRTAPENLKPADNVVIRLCSFECCFAHPFDDEKCEQNATFKKDIEDWSKICENLYVWDYATNFYNYNGMFPNFQVLQPNMQFFEEHNVIGVYSCGNYTPVNSNGEFGELRAYITAKLLWKPDADVETITKEFCKAYYGNAAEYIIEYQDIIALRVGNHTSITFEDFGNLTHVGIYADMGGDGMDFLTKGDIDYMNELWEKAKSADLTEQQLRNVRLSEISWRYWKFCNRKAEFTKLQTEKSLIEKSKAFYYDLKELGISQMHEAFPFANGQLSDNPDFTRTPNKWTFPAD